MTFQSQDSLRLQSKAIRQNSRSSDSLAAKIYFRTTRTCKFFGDFSTSKMSLPPSTITRSLQKLNHCLISVKKELNRLYILGTLITWFASYPTKSSQILKNHSIMLFTSNANSL